jgi:hypothetical protein
LFWIKEVPYRDCFTEEPYLVTRVPLLWIKEVPYRDCFTEEPYLDTYRLHPRVPACRPHVVLLGGLKGGPRGSTGGHLGRTWAAPWVMTTTGYVSKAEGHQGQPNGPLGLTRENERSESPDSRGTHWYRL